MNDLYRLIYTSRNFLGGSDAEQAAAVDGILAVSKRNNARVGVTGALLFNAGFFAQILEGPRAAVETTFERIQRDTRHSDVSVLQCEPVAARGFPNWSMAFVGQGSQGRTLWGDVAEQTGFDPAHVEADRLFATLLTIVERGENEDTPAPPPPARGPGLDVERLRGALRDRAPAVAPAPAGGESGVLRAALDEERRRTTGLRRELDDARIALAAARAEVEAAERLSEVWAERARAMAAILAREPGLARPDEAAPEQARPTLVRRAG
ncbi:BLUF domain-containing protein [Lichenibacterium dinghuense]|uniref:BLUF domain-containing protein n=1 Tax=Lichenibacterium dinghuense TaxID=2895977 RepID=UPI001F30DFE5|nr:BLUF domain-containing protein [Lichenibacterium sp. 6Y81]